MTPLATVGPRVHLLNNCWNLVGMVLLRSFHRLNQLHLDRTDCATCICVYVCNMQLQHTCTQQASVFVYAMRLHGMSLSCLWYAWQPIRRTNWSTRIKVCTFHVSVAGIGDWWFHTRKLIQTQKPLYLMIHHQLRSFCVSLEYRPHQIPYTAIYYYSNSPFCENLASSMIPHWGLLPGYSQMTKLRSLSLNSRDVVCTINADLSPHWYVLLHW